MRRRRRTGSPSLLGASETYGYSVRKSRREHHMAKISRVVACEALCSMCTIYSRPSPLSPRGMSKEAVDAAWYVSQARTARGACHSRLICRWMQEAGRGVAPGSNSRSSGSAADRPPERLAGVDKPGADRDAPMVFDERDRSRHWARRRKGCTGGLDAGDADRIDHLYDNGYRRRRHGHRKRPRRGRFPGSGPAVSATEHQRVVRAEYERRIL